MPYNWLNMSKATKIGTLLLFLTIALSSTYLFTSFLKEPDHNKEASYVLRYAERIEREGQQDWGRDVIKLVQVLINQSGDPKRLVNDMLQSDGASIRSFALVLIVKNQMFEYTPQITAMKSDRGFNLFSEVNADMANDVLNILQKCKNKELTPQDREYIEKWIGDHRI